MRVTQNITNRLYIKQNNYLQESMLAAENRIMTQKQYTRASQDSLNASKALIVRSQLRDLDMYDDNLNTAKEIYSAAETSLYTIANNIYIDASKKLETACNSTYNQDQLNIFADELEQYASLSIETLNADYSGRQLLGGSNNSEPPFSTELVNGNYVVKYNGVAVDDAVALSDFPGSDPIYVDVGIGIKYDSNYNIDPQTAVDLSLNGAEITGYGSEKDANGDKTFSNNFVQMLYDAAAALKDGDQEKANAMLDRLDKAHSGILSEITTLGARQNSMDFYINKNEDYRYSLTERQNEVEGCDIEKEATDWKTLDAAYQASLQMSSSVLPKSIFDFI